MEEPRSRGMIRRNMEESRSRGVIRLKICFLISLTVTLTLVILLQLSTNVYQKWLFTSYMYSQNQLTVILKEKDMQSSENSYLSAFLTTPTARSYGKAAKKHDGKILTETASGLGAHSESIAQLSQNNFTAVVLLTYMRSGSSLTGDILQQPKNAFYVFEPLKNVDRLQTLNESISFLNGTVMAPRMYDQRTLYLDTLLGWLTCNFSRVYLQSMLDLEFLSLGKNLKFYSKCIMNRVALKNVKKLSTLNLTKRLERQKNLLMTCINDLREVCLRSKYRVVKTIRADMSVAADVLKQVKGSKIIHLVRDPRATIESKRHRKACPLGIPLCIQEHCQRVREDILQKKNLDPLTLSKRFHTVLYEDVATEPVETAKVVYSFIGMKFTPNIEDYVYNVTLGKNKTGCSVCTLKWQIGNSDSSSRTHVDAWKQKLPSNLIDTTQQSCNDVIKYYGYEYNMVTPLSSKNVNIRVTGKGHLTEYE